ncbi:NAD(P)-dependent dehydrogenase (short-subunit alcohol dehydrogenase family) [Actinocorallia herbida]|uniref:NAD(P)-dependent dehydrogenase (Short-subunit alcohol dehydrogenase family) n=1 Tax=Actinocorallia herbida TaxID=58109 RepID=A0A3N1D2X6_9ACTN|nr:SDR family NAD(P)-dependent oxidoreductase [Actinocorallia herbida]ROO87881.1 NAD(P)-dependent dehydrogenase (short-subunit alcohol dehydrogenase family) [Actinocorallia herbida]
MRIESISALVTGGASGLGLGTVKRLAKAGAHVVIADLPRSQGQGVAEELGENVRFVPTDVTSTEQVQAAIAAAREAGPLRALVHCAGIGNAIRVVGRDGEPGDLAGFERVIGVNLIGSYNVLRLGAAAMAANEPVDGERGAIVLTASVAAFEGQIGQIAYSASKSGVVGMTIVAARDLASRNVRVNTIAPGLMDTPLFASLREDVRQSLASAIPNPQRFGTTDEYAHTAQFIIENAYVNGETIRLDGAIRMAPR